MRLAGMAVLCAGIVSPAFADWPPAPTLRPTPTPWWTPAPPTPRPTAVLTPSATPLPTPIRTPTPPPVVTPSPGGGPTITPTPVPVTGQSFVVTFVCVPTSFPYPKNPNCTVQGWSLKLRISSESQGVTLTVVPE